MSINVYNFIEDIPLSQWNDLISRSRFSSFFQTPQCLDFYKTLPFLKPFVYGIAEDSILQGIVVGYITAENGKIKGYFSRRAVILGGLLLSETISDDALIILLQHIIKELEHQAIFIEIRNNNDYCHFRSIYGKNGFQYQPHLNFLIPLTDKETAFKQLSESKRRQIKTALKKGVHWEVAERKEDIHIFYDVLRRLYNTKVKRSLFPVEFIQNLIQSSVGKLLLVKKGNKIIGGIVCIIFSDKVAYELYVCGDKNAEKELYPSVMATWAGIEYAIQNNIACFDFMGAGKPDVDYGVREFKSKFGGELVEYGRFLYICKPVLYRIGKYFVEKVLQKVTFYKM